MLSSFFNSSSQLRNRFASGRRYEAISRESLDADGTGSGVKSPLNVAPDSVALSNSIPDSGLSKRPLMLEYPKGETLAFGTVGPKKKPLKGAATARLPEFLDREQSEIVTHNADDSFLYAKYNEEHRQVGLSIVRDNAGWLAFHIFELSETPDAEKTFGPFSYFSAASQIQEGITEACKDGRIFDERSGEVVTKDYAVMQIYDPRLREAEIRSQAHYARSKAENAAMQRRCDERDAAAALAKKHGEASSAGVAAGEAV